MIETVIHGDIGEYADIGNIFCVKEIGFRNGHREPMLRAAPASGKNEGVRSLGWIDSELPAEIEVEPRGARFGFGPRERGF